MVFDYDDPDYPAGCAHPKSERIGTLDYTSGTTGNPKGLVYHHRGAARWPTPTSSRHGQARRLSLDAAYLPLQRLVLSVDAGGACRHYLYLRWVRPKPIYDAIADHGVTHLCGAAIVMSTLINARPEDKREFSQTVTFTPRPRRRWRRCDAAMTCPIQSPRSPFLTISVLG